jgi:hypothetical protein
VTPVLWVDCVNDVDADGTLSLNGGSVRAAIAKLSEPLREGQQVILAMDELEPGVADVWVRGTVHRASHGEYCEVHSDWKYERGTLPSE